ncbi:MAG: TolC family protein, partial [Blastocatellia bacterium]
MTALTGVFGPRGPLAACCMAGLILASASASRAQEAVGIETTASTPHPISSLDLVRRALASNGELVAARLDIDRGRARRRQAGLVPNPSFDFEQRTGRFTGAPGEKETTIGIAVPIEIGGQRRSRLEFAEAEIAAVEADIANRERLLTNEVRSRYAEALAAARELEILDNLGKIDAETARFVSLRISEGDSAPLDLRLLQAEIGRLQARRSLVEGRLASALVELRTIVGVATDEPLPLAENLGTVTWSAAPATLGEATAIALQTRPDLRLATLEQVVAEAGLRLVRAQAAPDVTAFSRFTVESSVFDDTPVGIIRDRDRTLSFGVSIGLPVFNRNQGARAEAETAIVQAARRRAFAESRVRADVSAAYTRFRAAEAAVATFEHDVIARSEANVESVRGAYLVGAYRISELLAEQRRLVESQREFTETLTERYRALADLQAAMGVAPAIGERPRTPPPAPRPTQATSYPGAPRPYPDPNVVAPIGFDVPVISRESTAPVSARTTAADSQPE